MAYENLTLERDGQVATLTIDRPKALNALNHQTLDEMSAALREVEADPAVRALIITGAGERAFVAGADISEMRDMGADEARAHATRGQAVMDQVDGLSAITIAAVNGYALGGGLELALACDLRYASDNAIVGLPEVSLGVIPGFGGTQRLARLIGAGRAMELVVTGRKDVTATEAERFGLVNRVVTQEKLMAEVRQVVDGILANGPRAVRLAKATLKRGLETDLTTGLTLERDAFGLAFATDEQTEGMTAFLEKRKPTWAGKKE